MFDATKPLATRDGRAVRLLATDMNVAGSKLLAGLVTSTSGSEFLACWSQEGRISMSGENALDLVNVPATQDVFVVAFTSKAYGGFTTFSRPRLEDARDLLDVHKNNPCNAGGVLVRIKIVEGEWRDETESA